MILQPSLLKFFYPDQPLSEEIERVIRIKFFLSDAHNHLDFRNWGFNTTDILSSFGISCCLFIRFAILILSPFLFSNQGCLILFTRLTLLFLFLFLVENASWSPEATLFSIMVAHGLAIAHQALHGRNTTSLHRITLWLLYFKIITVIAFIVKIGFNLFMISCFSLVK